MLKHQLASIYLYQPQCDVTVTVCHGARDEATIAIINRFRELFGDTLTLDPCCMFESSLFRRAIGRDIVSRTTEASVLWFADVDMMFGSDALDVAHDRVLAEEAYFMPSEVQISYDNAGIYADKDRPHHHVGETMLRENRQVDLPEIDPSLFGGPWKGPCIGGVQIVNRYVARRHGYLPSGHRLLKPVDESLGFRSCKGDPKFRRYMKKQGVPGPINIDIPNVYRIRHLSDGRDYAQDGSYVGKEAW